MKKLISILLTAVVAVGLCACTTTTTETTTKDGKTTTTTTVTKNGKTTTTTTTSSGTISEQCEDGKEHTFTITFKNSSDVDIEEFYVTEAGAKQYKNLLDDDETIDADDDYDYKLTCTKGKLTFDFGILPEDKENPVWFNDCDLSNFDPAKDEFEFALEDDGWHLKC